MSVCKKKKKAVRQLKSLDPFSSLSSKTKRKISLCDITVLLYEGKKRPVIKKLGSAFLEVRRSSVSYRRTLGVWPNINYGFVREIEYQFLFKVKYKRKNEQIGKFVARINDKGMACIVQSGIDEDRYKGLGLGKKAYEAMAGLLRVLESDPNGSTSTEAQRVWKSMKAKKVNRNRFRLVSRKKVEVERCN